jgi:hypothetical protein
MTKTKLYRYIGYNGTITSPVLLPDVNHLVVFELRAEAGNYLTDGNRKVYSIIVAEDDIANWQEVKGILE